MKDIFAEKLAEGKTKVVWAVNSEEVLIENKDDITAGDGAKKDSFENKGVYSTTTTVNVFKLLGSNGIKTHFIKQSSATSFFTKRLEMIPIEVVVRRIAFGSYLKRNPSVLEETFFDIPVVEFFLKDDSRNDPYMQWNSDKMSFLLYKPKKPLSNNNIIGNIQLDDLLPGIMKKMSEWQKRLTVHSMAKIAEEAFVITEDAWLEQGVTLVDYKVELGFDSTGQLMLGDVIDNDSWRIWFDGEMKDKEVFRQGGDIEDVTKNYKWVAEQTENFLA